MNNNTEAVIYLENIRHNLRKIKQHTGKTELVAVLKGDAYSHGLLEVANICLEENIKKLCVGSLEEAILLRENHVETQSILLLLPPCRENIDALAAYNICPTVYRLEHLHLIKEKSLPLPFEIEINTGIGRSGCGYEEFQEILHFITVHQMHLQGIYTHFFNKNSQEDCLRQLKEFRKYKCGIQGVKYHVGGAYALCYGKEFLLDELRVGIGMYGLAEFDRAGCVLKPALALNSRICDLIEVRKGERIGYKNNEFVFQRDSRLALLNFGSSFGYPEFEKKIVKVKNQFCEIVGGINMMNCCVDVTDVSDVRVGDWVNIYSPDNADRNSILQLSKTNHLKPGRFIYGLNPGYIRRRYVNNQGQELLSVF